MHRLIYLITTNSECCQANLEADILVCAHVCCTGCCSWHFSVAAVQGWGWCWILGAEEPAVIPETQQRLMGDHGATRAQISCCTQIQDRCACRPIFRISTRCSVTRAHAYTHAALESFN